MEVGAHTVNHPILARLDEEESAREIEASKKTLEAVIDAPVVGFAYPNGKPDVDFSPRDANLTRNMGFDYAVSTEWRGVGTDSDIYALPRVSPALYTGPNLLMRVLRERY